VNTFDFMCTLTYLLTNSGYELFFNRDEQHQRPLALVPQLNDPCCAVFPIDPQGEGTWLAVNKSGLTLALLNYYQACNNTAEQEFISRGQLIPNILLALVKFPTVAVIDLLNTMDLTIYQPFQLAIFPHNLTKNKAKVDFYQWNGKKLRLTIQHQPFTSSGVDFEYVEKQRKNKFKQLICPINATREQFKAFHLSQETEGKYSVNMVRFDAKTVSISHILVKNLPTVPTSNELDKDITFNYIDNINHQEHQVKLS